MYVRCTTLKQGPGPSEATVSVQTSGGHDEELIVSTDDITHGYLEVGNLLGRRDDERLIEFPRESASGRWRVWVHKGELTASVMADAAE